jgi:transposase
MSLRPQPLTPVPDQTARVAHAAFPKGNPYLTLRDTLGTIFQDDSFADLYAHDGQPGVAPWRLALVTILQFRETLADRQAAEAVRARIDWKYLLGLELTDPGFDFSVLSEFRDRLLAGEAAARLLEPLLVRCRAMGLLKARGQQRTDATHVLAAVRSLHRLELVAETLRAALNELATIAPAWLQGVAPLAWYERYAKRIEDSRLPKEPTRRDAYAQTVGEDGFRLLDALESPEAPEPLRTLPCVATLRQLWQDHYERQTETVRAEGAPPTGQVRFKDLRELPRAAAHIESPYDVDVRYRTKGSTQWTGYMVHVSETCEDTTPHLLTHVQTTSAAVHEAMCTEEIHQALAEKDLVPKEHLVDAAYVDAALLVQSRQEYGIDLIGPTRDNASWQTKVDGAYDIDQFEIDWDRQQVRCPQGKWASAWRERHDPSGRVSIVVQFRQGDCQACEARAFCTRAKQARYLRLHPREQHAALEAARVRFGSDAGQTLYKRRAGIEGTLSQGVRAFGLRRTRYRGLDKTHLQHVAIATAINVDRLVAWFAGQPRATTRTSRFAALAPTPAMGPG